AARGRYPAHLDRYRANDAPATAIERETYAALAAMGVEFRRQARVAGFRVDALLPEVGVVVECQGDYWHCNPAIYLDGPQGGVQRASVERDAVKAARIGAAGYRLVLLWEADIAALGARALLEEALGTV